MNQSDDRFDDLIRRSLAREAERIEPADALPEIQARIRAERPARRRPWLLTTGAAVLGAAAAIGAFTVLDDGSRKAGDTEVAGPGETVTASTLPATPRPAPSRPTTASPQAEPTASPKKSTEPEPSRSATIKNTYMMTRVPLYWVGDRRSAGAGPTMRLYRTFVDVKGDPLMQAVQALTEWQAEDPDYYSAWTGAVVGSVSRSDGAIRVDFKVLPSARVPKQSAEVAVQQLVYTVQGVLRDPKTPVLITERGEPARLFGMVDTRRPIVRADQAKVQALVWISSPGEGATVKSPVRVSGTAAAFEATVNWRITNLTTRRSSSGFANTAEGQKFSQYGFEAKLDPGLYQIEAYLLSAEDGSVTDIDSKRVSVR